MSAHPITRLNAALEGRYRIESELGEGGMANVYLAADLKHERKVALKVLKPELAAVVGAERFLAEIKTTANLQHPHILPLFDSGEADGFLFYVMPFVEGETLRDRLEREKQLPVDEAVRIATDVAEALQAAHEQGVIHRDIKPANILMSKGRPLVADFGIALAVSAAGGGRLTETGLSMGTPYYMSPEQASADREPSAASDVYSLGCVLYEMLVGEPPYTGGSAQAVLAKILTEDARAPTKARPSIPANVDAAIRKALEKLPADRFAAVQDLAKALAEPGFRHGEVSVTSAGVGGGRWKFLAMGLAFTTISFGALAGRSLLSPERPQPVERFASPFLPGQGVVNSFNISDDGSMLVYGGVGDQLWVRRWRDLRASPIPGTTGAAEITVSPDGTQIAFQTGPWVAVLSLSGGSPRALVQGGSPFWGLDDYIYVRGFQGQGVNRVPAKGGSPEPVTRLGQGHQAHWVTDVLPGGGSALINVLFGSRGSEIHAVDLDTGEMKFLTSGANGRYASTGHLVFQVQTGDLMAVRFDPDAMEVRGVAVSVVRGASQPRLSRSGTLIYLDVGEGAGQHEFVWVGRSGEQEPLGWPFTRGQQSRGWNLSPHDTRLAFTADGADPGSQNIWIKELPDGPMTLLADEEGQAWNPKWRADGETLIYSLGETGSRAVLSRRADGTGTPQVLFDGSLDAPGGLLSPAEDWLLLRVGFDAGASRTIMAMRPGVDSVPLRLMEDGYNAVHPTLSPDGRWLAYTSDESGRAEVYVRPFPDTEAGRTQVSTDGGLQPHWANLGGELFFVSANREMWSAQYETTSGFRVVGRELLFEIPTGMLNTTNLRSTFYDTSSDDQRFLMMRRYGTDTEGFSGVVLVQNWTEELKELVPN